MRLIWRVAIVAIALVAAPTGPVSAGEAEIAEPLRSAWALAQSNLGTAASTRSASPGWVVTAIEDHVDTRYLARRLLARTDPEADASDRARLGEALGGWLSWRARRAVERHGQAWRGLLDDPRSMLLIQRSAVDGSLATAVVELRLGDRRWDALAQLHRRGGVWRVYDIEVSGLSLQGLLRALWADVRGDGSLAAGIAALKASK